MTVRAPWPRLLLPAGFAVAFAVLAWIVLARHGSPYGIDTGPHHWSVAHRPHAYMQRCIRAGISARTRR